MGLIGAPLAPVPKCRIATPDYGQIDAKEAAQAAADAELLSRIEEGDIEFMKRDKRRNDDLNVGDPRMTTAVHKACKHHDCEILKVLIEKGAYADFPDRDGVRPMAEVRKMHCLLPGFVSILSPLVTATASSRHRPSVKITSRQLRYSRRRKTVRVKESLTFTR